MARRGEAAWIGRANSSVPGGVPSVTTQVTGWAQTATGIWVVEAFIVTPNVIASPFYTSAAFWGAGGFVAILLVGAVTIYITYRLGSAKRQLTYGIVQNTLLLGPAIASEARSNLKVLFQERPLHSPRILSIRLVSRGRKDIRSEDFDQGRPITLDLGVRLVAFISADANPKPFPKIIFQGTSLEIGPDLIRRRQVITITVLADGAEPRIACDARLIDVNIQHQTYNRSLPSRMKALAIIAAIVTAASAALAFATDGRSLNAPPPPLSVVALILSGAASALMLFSVAWLSSYRKIRRSTGFVVK
jgi:hypothetical protein